MCLEHALGIELGVHIVGLLLCHFHSHLLDALNEVGEECDLTFAAAAFHTFVTKNVVVGMIAQRLQIRQAEALAPLVPALRLQRIERCHQSVDGSFREREAHGDVYLAWGAGCAVRWDGVQKRLQQMFVAEHDGIAWKCLVERLSQPTRGVSRGSIVGHRRDELHIAQVTQVVEMLGRKSRREETEVASHKFAGLLLRIVGVVAVVIPVEERARGQCLHQFLLYVVQHVEAHKADRLPLFQKLRAAMDVVDSLAIESSLPEVIFLRQAAT